MSFKFGDPRLPSKFWECVHPMESGCWLWSGHTTGVPNPYGTFYHRLKNHFAHRFAYKAAKGEINAECLDHLCRVRLCVNPEHLEPVSMRENMMRGFSFTAMNAKKTECHRGHPLSGENLLIRKSHGRLARACLTCKRTLELAWWHRNKGKSTHEVGRGVEATRIR